MDGDAGRQSRRLRRRLSTAFLNLKLRILHILAGILTAIALYSINLRIMDRPNIGLINMPTVYTPFEHLGSRRFTRPSCCSRSSS